MKAPISEIYHVVQAEGLHKTPAVFVRFWGCNLRCAFNGTDCDTPYAVYKGEKDLMTQEQIIDKIKSFNCKHIVFTGGEPMLFQKMILEIISYLGTDYFIEIETNGTIEPQALMWGYIDQFNISVKLKSSNQWDGYDNKRINPDALILFPHDKSIFKFVVCSEDDIDEIKEIIKIAPDIKVYLMPEGDNRETLLKNIAPTMELCLKYGWGFTNRDHILAYDKKRGV